MSRLLNTLKNISFPLIIFLVALLPRITSLSDTFIVNDETLYWSWSNEFINAVLNRDWAGTMVGKGYPSITVFWVHGLGLAVQAGLDFLLGYTPQEIWKHLALDRPFIFALLGPRRLTMGLVNTLLITLTFFPARKLMGNAIALLGCLLMALSPFLLADARTMRGDAMMSHFMLLSVLTFLLFLTSNRWLPLIISAVTLGLAILTKITALPVAGFVLLAVVIQGWRKHKHWTNWFKWVAGVMAGWSIGVGVTIILLWPAIWTNPLAVLAFVREYATSSIDGRLNYFWGQLTTDEPLPLFYPNAFLFRATPLVTVGVAITVILTVMTLWRLVRRSAPIFSLNRSYRTVLALNAYALIYWFILNLGALKRDRYLMPVFPAAMFIAAFGLLWLVRQAGQRWPGSRLPAPLNRRSWAGVIFTILFGWQITTVFATHPFYYTYWSPLMGGGRVAQYVMMAESGVETSALVELSHQPNSQHETVALLYTRDFAPAYTGQTVRLNNSSPWITAHHVLLRQYHFQTQKLDKNILNYLLRRPPERIIEYQGYIWGWIYPGPAAQYYAGSQLDGKAQLLGYSLDRTSASPNQPLTIKLFWQNQGYQPPEFIFVRLVDETGFIWAETTVEPLPEFTEQAYMPEVYMEGEAQLPIPVGTPPGLYFLKIGIATPDKLIGEFSLPADGDDILVEKSSTTPPPPLTRTFNQPLGPHITLLGAQITEPLILTPRRTALLTLYWQADAPVTKNYNLALCLVADTGEQAGCWQGQPARGRYPWIGWQTGEPVRDPWQLDLSVLEDKEKPPPDRYMLKLYLLEPKTNKTIGETLIAQVEVMDRLRQYTLPPLDREMNFKLGQAITLRGYNLTEAPLTGGARLTLTLFWQAIHPIDTDYTVFTQVLGPDGRLVGQHDGVPAEGTIPTSSWDIGEIVPDRHILEFSIQQPGKYRLIAGMYNPITKERVPVIDASGNPAGDFITLYSFSAPPSE